MYYLISVPHRECVFLTRALLWEILHGGQSKIDPILSFCIRQYSPHDIRENSVSASCSIFSTPISLAPRNFWRHDQGNLVCFTGRRGGFGEETWEWEGWGSNITVFQFHFGGWVFWWQLFICHLCSTWKIVKLYKRHHLNNLLQFRTCSLVMPHRSRPPWYEMLTKKRIKCAISQDNKLILSN